jgi:membrane-associated phospholipid phosphatase
MPGRRPAVAAVVCALAFGAVAWLVVAGKLQWIDNYALDHWMPGFRPTPSNGLDVDGLWRPFPLDIPWWKKVLDLWTYPASALVSALVFGGGALLLWRRGRPRAAIVWMAAWIAGNAIEFVGKHTLDRPLLRLTEHGMRVPVPSFHESFPSGHTIRAVLVASFVVLLWPAARRPAAVWAVLTLAFLVVTAAHTPSDVLGGLLVAGVLLLALRAVPQ